MITKGEILSINILENTCRVRLPIFETTNNDIISTTATFSVPPGLYNSFQAGDIVYVGFEQDDIRQAVILGKLYINSENEANLNRGAINCNTLKVTERVDLPSNTNITYDLTEAAVNADGRKKKMKTIKDIIDYLQKLDNKIEEKTSSITEDINTLKLSFDEKIAVLQEEIDELKQKIQAIEN